jgi:tRNA(Ile)-lysidine synthetase-like protein
VIERLAETARIAGAEENFWAAMVDERVATLAKVDGEEISIAVENLLAPLPAIFGKASDQERAKAGSLALTRRIVVRLLERAAGERVRFTAHHVERVVKLAAQGSSNQRVDLPQNLKATREFDRLCFSRAGAEFRGEQSDRSGAATAGPNGRGYAYDVNLPAIGQGGRQVWVCETQTCFNLKLIDAPRMESETSRQGEALDAELLCPPLILRNWRPGDAYRPNGRRSVRKLKEMFLRSRVPAKDRLRWPVLTCAGRVAWVQGMPPAAEFAAGEKTRKYLVIDAEQLR